MVDYLLGIGGLSLRHRQDYLHDVHFKDGDYQYEDVSSLLREYEEEFIPNHQVADVKICKKL